VPRPARESSSSTLAFSYTHVTAPNPSSYPREETLSGPKAGWTLIKKAEEEIRVDAVDSIESGSFVVDDSEEGPGDVDVEGDMIITDMESLRDQNTTLTRSTLNGNIDEIIHGMRRLCY
jgi:hypothetical protein